jgi:hypothetical protein
MKMAVANPYVEMFIWFILRDSSEKTWRSGLLTRAGLKKPAYAVFTAHAKRHSGQMQYVKPRKQPAVRVSVPFLTWFNRPGSPIGVTWRLFEKRKFVAVGQARPRLGNDQTITFKVRYRPVNGKTYRLVADVHDIHGQRTIRTVMLVSGTPVTTVEVKGGASKSAKAGARSRRR